ncbi:hypothetical protein BCM0100_2013 [Bacillus cereus]|nr:hypothetical protein BCM0100_2013 [Bacillus cereus]
MVSFFPTMYEDELIYSVIARYHVRSGNTMPKQTILDLFDGEVIRVYPGIPVKLKLMHERISSLFDIGSLEELINNHTMYNYISNFGREKIKSDLLRVLQGNLTMNVGRETHFHSNLKFKYCPRCVVDDYEKYGETYWRRNHQLTGVVICLTHQEFLRLSDVLWSPFFKGDPHKFEHANLTNCPIQRESVYNDFEGNMELLMKITEQCIRVATNKIPINFTEITDIYRVLLYRKRYIRGNLVELKRLYKEFRDFYGNEMLELLNVNFEEGKRSNWVATILKKNKQTFHPLKHILIITFLGENTETFDQYDNNSIHPFGAPPYICLNPFASHYQQPVIQQATLHTQGERELCYFVCNCGFEFTREIGDSNVRVCQIKNTGPWEREFEQLYKSFKSGSNTKEPRRYYNLYRKYIDYINGQNCRGPKKNPGEYKQKWLAAIKEYPEYSTSRLAQLYKKEYVFLFRHCKDWLMENRPIIENYGFRSVNWEERDKEILKELKIVVQHLLENKNPQRITRNRLKREIVDSSVLELRFLKKLPTTKLYLSSVVESIEQFQIRRVENAIQKLIENGKSITYYNLLRASNINTKSIKLGTHKKITEIIDDYNFEY